MPRRHRHQPEMIRDAGGVPVARQPARRWPVAPGRCGVAAFMAWRPAARHRRATARSHARKRSTNGVLRTHAQGGKDESNSSQAGRRDAEPRPAPGRRGRLHHWHRLPLQVRRPVRRHLVYAVPHLLLRAVPLGRDALLSPNRVGDAGGAWPGAPGVVRRAPRRAGLTPGPAGPPARNSTSSRAARLRAGW
jgi:hypothetical protein